MHDGGAGGDPNSGSADARGEVALPKGWQELSPGEQERLRAVGRTIDEASRRLRSGQVAPALLRDLGMTAGELAGFVERYRTIFGRTREMPDRTERPGETVLDAFRLPGSGQMQSGRKVDGKLGDVTGSEKLTPDELRKLYESRAAKVSPEYRKQVEAYFRAISEAAGQTGAGKPTSRPGR